MRAILVPAMLVATPALANPPLTAEAFAAHVGTDTLDYAYSTGDRGTADYGPDRTLRWAFEGEPCFDGRLSACWQFVLDGPILRGTVTERGSGNSDPLQIWETGRRTTALACPGPDVGV